MTTDMIHSSTVSRESGSFRIHRSVEKSRILVVDDENGPRQALRMLLKEEYDVFLASSGRAALTLLEEQEVDLVITDIRMPEMTGIDLLRQIRRQHVDVQVIILTGYGQLDTAMEAIEHGAFAYIEKPFDNDVMLGKVRACLERKRLEQERRALEYLAMEANRFETLGRLISGTFHDLGTPLSVIGTNLELLMSQPQDEKVLKRLTTMRSQVQHCNDLVRTTMNFLRQSPQNFAPFSLNSVVMFCLEVARPVLLQEGVVVVTRMAKDFPLITGDLVMVRQAVLNVVYNACQAMIGQAEARTLCIESFMEGEVLCLAVQDNGPGVARETEHRIFDTLYSTKGKKGTGLGLAVVNHVMHRHQGTVCLERHAGRGARFVLRFPRQDA